MKRAALIFALLTAPASAAVYEVSADGALERLDAPVTLAPVTLAAAAAPGNVQRLRASARANSFRPDVERAGSQYEVSPALIDAIAHVESRYNPSAVSPARAIGIMQLMPGTALELGVDARNPSANIRGGTAYLRKLLNRFDGDLVRTIAAYNAGPGAVSKAGGVPDYRETKAYVTSVMNRLAALAQ
ncbi:MAG: lytic transglycosylase domain-containing protein [Sandarakinorhabdus sp.]|nr:lytic transglycosylase domain-containing protein [Sandarakinorhabdus sp.]